MRKSLLALVLCMVLAGVSVSLTSLTGAGSTFTYPMMSKWSSDYKKLHPDIEINYQSIGSGGGIKQITEGTVDFGATDGPMNDQQISEFKQKRGTDILHFPTTMGADVASYNIPGVTATLKFTQKAIAGIFLGTITKWNDPEITKANPGVNFPTKDNEIIVVHRSDGSGTTYIWTDFLSKISPEWKSKVGVGAQPNWPVGLGGKGNEGVTGMVKATPNSIGYIELIYAIQNGITYGDVQNADGAFVKASLASVSEAAAGAAKNMPNDFRVSITNAPGKGAYPVSSFTWLLIPAKIQDATKRDAIKSFLKWILADGQNDCEALSYAKLPAQVITKETKALSLIQ
jgi:phosphate transport system substrate-binding protein